MMIDGVISKVETFLILNPQLSLKIINNGGVRSLSEFIEMLRKMNADEFHNEQDVLDIINNELTKNINI